MILGFFVAMFVVAKTRPLAGSVGALAGFVGLHILLAVLAVLAVLEPASITLGIIGKIVFLLALVGAVRAGSRAERLLKP